MTNKDLVKKIIHSSIIDVENNKQSKEEVNSIIDILEYFECYPVIHSDGERASGYYSKVGKTFIFSTERDANSEIMKVMTKISTVDAKTIICKGYTSNHVKYILNFNDLMFLYGFAIGDVEDLSKIIDILECKTSEIESIRYEYKAFEEDRLPF